MIKLSGYEALEEIHAGKNTLIYRGVTEKDRQPVILKTIKSAYPTPEEITRLKKEYEITDRFDGDGVIRTLGLTSVVSKPVLIQEDFGGIALAEVLEQGPLEMSEFLPLAIRLTEALAVIHAQNIIHKNVNPANIVWNRERDVVKFIDFGISLKLSREVTAIKNPNVLEGTLAYISPEQTGRMNRFLDYRTDYYSLGITFYQMLTGRLPFESTDAMEMVHAHIARFAPALHELDGKIPRAVSGIVYKLMAKNVEDRYQSGKGLVADLKRCRNDFSETGRVSIFTPGQTDFSERLQIPEKLYGREGEIASLLTAFERASQGERELMLVSGLPGIGKTVLVNEIQKPIVRLRGNFIAGKYGKLKKDVPYSALLQAFSGLVKYLLAENEERLADWRSKILEALGPNGRVITEVIPRLELVIGKQPELPVLGPEESRNRFNLYFRFFMGVFCKEEHPLVLFLDDLQWADQASLEMLKLFLSDPDSKHFFVIGAFRSTEVDAGHPLNLILDEIKKTGIRVNSTAVTALGMDAVTDLLRDSLHCDAETCTPLAELLLRKTGGNPFFLGEFLKTLYQDGLLTFLPEGGWTWDIRKIEARQITENVVELMASKIEGLSGDCGEALKLGACFANYFKLEALAEIAGKSPAKIEIALNMLLEEGLLIKREENYNFAHDRIQEAAYSLLPKSERIKQHHRIGLMELKQTSHEENPQNLFYLVNQLNAGRRRIESGPAQLELAELNLRAGAKARSAAAHRPALNYLEIALGLLGADSWENNYELTLKVKQEAISAAFLCGDYERMYELADTVIGNARDVLDTVGVYEAKIFAAIARNQHLQAIGIGIMILGRLGLRLPANPGKLHVLLGFLSVKRALRGKSLGALENHPSLNEPRKLAILQILSSIASSAILVSPNLAPLIIFKVLIISVKNGNTKFSPRAYAAYGMIQCGLLGDMERGHGFGQLALSLVDKLNIQGGGGSTQYAVQFMIKPWKEHMRNTLQPLKGVIRSGREAGEPEYFGYAANTYVVFSFFCGRELPGLEEECAQFKGMIGKLNQLHALYTSSMEHQLLLNLLGRSDNPHILKGESYDIDLMLPMHKRDNDENNIFRAQYFNCFLNYMFGRYENALEYGELAEQYVDPLRSSVYIPSLIFYKSLAQLALYQKAEKREQRKYLRNVAGNQKRMKRYAVHAPMNFEHKYQLVEAEKARLQGRELKASDLYEKAIQGARENQYINDEALALELYGKFWLELGKIEFASLYMSKARQAYGAWGAPVKVHELEEDYPQLISTFLYEKVTSDDVDETLGKEGNEETERDALGKLDLMTVVKASQTIASEINLGNLLGKMIQIVMENAGASSGYLILENNNGLYVEAARDMETEDVRVLESLPLAVCRGLSPAIVQYAARTLENVVLNDASNIGAFTADEHIIGSKPKSILCSPILNQGKLSAILYLENNLSTGAFTADRLEVLNMLSSQIAVSIDNARLYGNLEDKVQERTLELQEYLGQVQALKKKQDGDYFLTSLLINPLARNDVKSERVTVDFLVQQHKQFKYQKWGEELGGDICIAHSVRFENTGHTIFLNADAMGKSMQGAGGALVLGAVFQSIIERTGLAAFDESQSATTWLRDVVKELQAVFESFDGRMLISLVLGAVNDESGVLHLINAEHPWPVLYRNGKADFIHRGVSVPKLGVWNEPEEIKVYNVQLEAGDVFIAGSDGRDDIRIISGGDSSINSDETQFLLRVEEGAGKLPEIKAALLGRGELTDDLSLLRLEYE